MWLRPYEFTACELTILRVFHPISVRPYELMTLVYKPVSLRPYEFTILRVYRAAHEVRTGNGTKIGNDG